MAALPRVLVVLDFGAASPMSILAAARGTADVAFLADRSLPYVRGLFDDLRELAPVHDITGRSEREVHDLVEHLDPAGITTFSESRLTWTAALAHRRGAAFLSPETARAVTDKHTQRHLLAGAGVQHTRCRIVRGTADLAAALADVGLPAILKPRHGAASAYTCRIDSGAEAGSRLRDFLAAGPRDFVVEQFLTGDPSVAGSRWGDYVSVESVTSGGETRHLEVTGKFPLAAPLRETGYVVPSTLGPAAAAQVLDLTSAALAALGVRDGVTHVELKLTADGPRVIEVNGRLGGYVADLVRRARGFDLVRTALVAALGRHGDAAPASYRRHAFQYFLMPPPGAVALRRLDGVDALQARRGLTVELLKKPGDPLDWRLGTLTYLGIVHGSGTDHDDVLRLVDVIDDTLRIDYRYRTEEPPPSHADDSVIT